MAAMIRLRSSGRSCGTGGRTTEFLAYLHKKKNGMPLGQVILVVGGAASGLLQRVWTEMGYRLDVCRVA